MSLREAFRSAAWNRLKRVGRKKDYRTEFKAVYSGKGLYFLFRCEDKRISCTFQKDGEASRYAYVPACGTAFHDYDRFGKIIFG